LLIQDKVCIKMVWELSYFIPGLWVEFKKSSHFHFLGMLV